MHWLLRKKAMDPVNEALLKPTEYPAADKDFDHPNWFKGTEMEDKPHLMPRFSARGFSRKAEIDLHEGPKNGGNPNYLQRTHMDEDVRQEIDEDLVDEPTVPVRHESRLLRRKA